MNVMLLEADQILLAFLISPMRATCRNHLIFCDLLTLTVIGEENSLRTPHYEIFSDPLLLYFILRGANILHSTFLSETLNTCYFPGARDKVS
jgi:hypothetical protein